MHNRVWRMRGYIKEDALQVPSQSGVTCLDDSCLRVCCQQAQHVKVAVVQHVVLKVFQRQGWFKKLPVAVVWEVIVNEQSWVSQKIKLIVSGRKKRLKENELL